MAIITLPSTPQSKARIGSFHLVTSDAELVTNFGVAQITVGQDRRWVCTLSPPPLEDDDLREWVGALVELASKENVIAIGPPHYTGPSTGYSGSGPLVAGGSQLGKSLDVDGLTGSQAILKRGDFLSFDTTSTGGMPNRQLFTCTDDVSSSAGVATIPLSYPIRQAPANNAAVNIFTPSAYFALLSPKGGLDSVVPGYFGEVTLEAEERIWK